MCYLVSIVARAEYQAIRIVGVGWDRAPLHNRGQEGERDAHWVGRGQLLTNSAYRDILWIDSSGPSFIGQLSEKIGRADKMEEELLKQLLTDMGIRAGKITLIELSEIAQARLCEMQAFKNIVTLDGREGHWITL